MQFRILEIIGALLVIWSAIAKGRLVIFLSVVGGMLGIGAAIADIVTIMNNSKNRGNPEICGRNNAFIVGIVGYILLVLAIIVFNFTCK